MRPEIVLFARTVLSLSLKRLEGRQQQDKQRRRPERTGIDAPERPGILDAIARFADANRVSPGAVLRELLKQSKPIEEAPDDSSRAMAALKAADGAPSQRRAADQLREAFERANRNTPSGRLHLAEAVSTARRALESDDEEEIVVAAMLCQALERTDGEVLRRSGGRKRGKEQTAQALAEVWAPWISQYRALCESGVHYLLARETVKDEMTENEFVLPDTGEFPTDKTIAKWLPKWLPSGRIWAREG